MPAPTFVAEYEVSSWTTNAASKSVNVTTAIGDRILWLCVTRDAGTSISTLAPGSGMTWSYPVFVLTASNCGLYIGTATAMANETFSCTATATSGGTLSQWGFNVLRFSGSNGFGNSAANTPPATGVPSIGITNSQPNSAIVTVIGDYVGANGDTTRAWLTNAGSFTEQTYMRQSLAYAVYAGFHPNAGPASTYSVGLSAPSGQQYTIGAVEVLGTPSPYSPPPRGKLKTMRPLLVR